MNKHLEDPTPESINNFLKGWINTIPKHIRHDHGLCIGKLNTLVSSFTPNIIEVNEGSIYVHWTPYEILHMELRIMNDSITIKDYTYVIPPYYECTIKIY